ncbi:hypothetical protein P152DRAFT_470389 [Eremomyces bilateralis CBS 781.70]|uniref:Uncharacterized protein n=1 Tax=Eremomyces bilateralis CBS 781.70 TaxID=1392243 RepID=A0A6G1GE12_9PEZI|nr:uncharacterized protein P152DRAFT_470389 [Eremomyces bilateralis CBS 781.70]KAF1816355.1 hypothetical protein P152DRAFT_470389 [Eremomyces bilateralis CBS 781.70]
MLKRIPKILVLREQFEHADAQFVRQRVAFVRLQADIVQFIEVAVAQRTLEQSISQITRLSNDLVHESSILTEGEQRTESIREKLSQAEYKLWSLEKASLERSNTPVSYSHSNSPTASQSALSKGDARRSSKESDNPDVSALYDRAGDYKNLMMRLYNLNADQYIKAKTQKLPVHVLEDAESLADTDNFKGLFLERAKLTEEILATREEINVLKERCVVQGFDISELEDMDMFDYLLPGGSDHSHRPGPEQSTPETRTPQQVLNIGTAAEAEFQIQKLQATRMKRWLEDVRVSTSDTAGSEQKKVRIPTMEDLNSLKTSPTPQSSENRHLSSTGEDILEKIPSL